VKIRGRWFLARFRTGALRQGNPPVDTPNHRSALVIAARIHFSKD